MRIVRSCTDKVFINLCGKLEDDVDLRSSLGFDTDEALLALGDFSVIQFAPLDFGAWCKGSTPDFESVDLGSNPGAPAKSQRPAQAGIFLSTGLAQASLFCYRSNP